MTKQEIFDALVQRLNELEMGKGDFATVAERAEWMINGWFKFSMDSMDDRGHETCRDSMDPGIVELLDQADLCELDHSSWEENGITQCPKCRFLILQHQHTPERCAEDLAMRERLAQYKSN